MASPPPGPWESREIPDLRLIAVAQVGKMYPFATVQRWHDAKDPTPLLTEEDRATAALFVAAPDLLAELRGWLPIVERQLASIPPAPDSTAYQAAVARIERTRAAIAKATAA